MFDERKTAPSTKFRRSPARTVAVALAGVARRDSPGGGGAEGQGRATDPTTTTYSPPQA